MSCKSVLFVSICLLAIVIFVDGAPMGLHRYGSEGMAKIEKISTIYFWQSTRSQERLSTLCRPSQFLKLCPFSSDLSFWKSIFVTNFFIIFFPFYHYPHSFAVRTDLCHYVFLYIFILLWSRSWHTFARGLITFKYKCHTLCFYTYFMI